MGGEELETVNGDKFFKVFCCNKKQRIEVRCWANWGQERCFVIFKMGEISSREGNFGGEIEKGELSSCLDRWEGGLDLIYEWWEWLYF